MKNIKKDKIMFDDMSKKEQETFLNKTFAKLYKKLNKRGVSTPTTMKLADFTYEMINRKATDTKETK